MSEQGDGTDGPQLSVARLEDRYELRVDGEPVGFAAVERHAGAVAFTHTQIDPSSGGHGYGSALVKSALDDVVARGERIIPLCSFVSAYLRRHPEYADSVSVRSASGEPVADAAEPE